MSAVSAVLRAARAVTLTVSCDRRRRRVGLQLSRYRSDALTWPRSQQHHARETRNQSLPQSSQEVAVAVAIGSGEAAVVPVSGFP